MEKNEKFYFTPTAYNKKIEVWNSVAQSLTIEESYPNCRETKKTNNYYKILKLKKDSKYLYYFIYSYEIDISSSKEKYTTSKYMTIYIGKGTISRTLKYKRDFHSLKLFKQIKKTMIIKKDILAIYRIKKIEGMSTKILSKAVDNNFKIEKNLIASEKPIFNKKENGYSLDDKSYYYYFLKSNKDKNFVVIYLREKNLPVAIYPAFSKKIIEKRYRSDKYDFRHYSELESKNKIFIDKFFIDELGKNDNFINVFYEFNIFDTKFTEKNFIEEFIKSYKRK